MTRTMGLSDGAAASVTALEVGAVVTIATIAGLLTAPPVIRRLSGRFDPAPDRPPPVPIAIDWPIVGGVAARRRRRGHVGGVGVRTPRAGRSMAEVLRGDG